MEQVDQLTSANVKAGPLKAVFHRVFYRGNLDEELKPDFKNDAKVTPEKIIFLQTMLNKNEAYLYRQFGDQLSVLHRRLGEQAAIADFLVGDDPKEIVDRYSLDGGKNLRSSMPRDVILTLASKAAKLYSWQMREERDEMPIEYALEMTEEKRELTVRLPGFESLRNTVLDLYDARKFNNGEKYASGLLLLFERENPKNGTAAVDVLEHARRSLRARIDLSPELNRERDRGGSTDIEFRRGADLIRKLVQQRPRAMSQPVQYNTMAALEAEALMMEKGLAKEDARPFVESRIAYALHILYTNG